MSLLSSPIASNVAPAFFVQARISATGCWNSFPPPIFTAILYNDTRISFQMHISYYISCSMQKFSKACYYLQKYVNFFSLSFKSLRKVTPILFSRVTPHHFIPYTYTLPNSFFSCFCLTDIITFSLVFQALTLPSISSKLKECPPVQPFEIFQWQSQESFIIALLNMISPPTEL